MSAAKFLAGVGLGVVALGAAYQLRPDWFGLVRPDAPKAPPKAPPHPAPPPAPPAQAFGGAIGSALGSVTK